MSGFSHSSTVSPAFQETSWPQDLGRPEKLDYDLVIVGGGIVGLTLASVLKSSGLRIALVESRPRSAALKKPFAYAITLLSGRIFDGLGIWQKILPHITTFKTIRLADADSHAVVDLHPQDLGTPELGYVAEHRVLANALYGFLDQDQSDRETESSGFERGSGVTFHCPARVTEVTYQQDWVDVMVDEGDRPYHIQTRLVVAADGSQSPLRQQANIQTFGWPYWQSCVTAVIQPEKSHQNIAREHFWPSGPFATLPLPNNRFQIVLTAPHEDAKRFLEMDEADFLAELNRRYGHQLGRLTLVGDRSLFPVKLMHSKQYVRSRLALVGDAAHGCHPVGGQGMNMGIRDAAALAQVIATAHHQGQDIGSLAVLKPYERWRKRENWVILGFTDMLDRSFSNTHFIIMPLRRLGLRLMAALKPIKYLALRLMTGMGGRRPQVAKDFSSNFPESSGLSL